MRISALFFSGRPQGRVVSGCKANTRFLCLLDLDLKKSTSLNPSRFPLGRSCIMTAQPSRAPYRKFGKPTGPKPEPKILFQQFFKSVGPRTYVAQLKEAANGNHFLVLTEGKRDDKTNEVKKSRIFIYSEDFVAFFRLMKETGVFINAHPVPEKVKAKQAKVWAKKTQKRELVGTAPAA